MIDNVNVQAKDTSHSGVAGVSINSKSTAKAAGITPAEGGQSVNTEESPIAEESFQASLNKASKVSARETEVVDSPADGNVLPMEAQLTDDPAENDRSILASSIVPGLNLPELKQPEMNGKLPVKSLIEPVQGGEIETDILQNIGLTTDTGKVATLSNTMETESGPAVNLISSSIRSLLQAEAKTQAKNAPLQPGAAANVASLTESVLNKPLEIAPLNVDNADTLINKTTMMGQLQELSAQQIQALATMKNSSHLQAATAGNESAIEALPLSLSPASTNILPTSLSNVLQPEITEQFGRPAWAQGMSKQILWLANQNIRSAEIRLNPANLGPIEVRIDMRDDQINVALSSRHAVVREAMEMALPKLREMLDENGFNLADADISQHSFAEQREQNMASGQSKLFGDNAMQSDTFESADNVIHHTQLDTSMVDYYI